MANFSQPSGLVKARFLIISDTHGLDVSSQILPRQKVDVAIHCGDLTDSSTLEEFRASVQLIQAIEADLKLVIAGNHDWTMDAAAFETKVAEGSRCYDPTEIEKVWGKFGAARRILEEAEGITFLDEGDHQFTLANGAVLNVFASPFTPSLGDWGFQYPPGQGHQWSIKEGVDVAITHGPPLGLLDYTDNKYRAGCPDLFAAVSRARPRLHCFGHIHEGWGAKLVTWRNCDTVKPSHFGNIDNEHSSVVDKLSNYRPSINDSPATLEVKRKRMETGHADRCRMTSHCEGDVHPLTHGDQTLFVNAAIQGRDEDYPLQLPWLVDLELAKAGKE
ncbi:MAG: hypothetical protein Q9219_005088 [cf. Caloplaca sp. 3 TL-2023]